MSNIEAIKQIREETGISPTEIQKALQEASGDVEKAKELLRTWGKASASKKTSREVTQGIVDYYLHPNAKTGVLLDIRCESDFVAKSPDFKVLAHEICLQIAAMNSENVEVLLGSPWVKDGSRTIKNLIEEAVAKIGENIEVKKFVRYEI